jgi:hypothetical protein
MGLPTSDQRALNRIEIKLADDHPSLGPLFAIFTKLVGHEAMPVTERVTAPPWPLRWRRRIRPGVAVVVGLAMVTVALFTLSLTLPSTQACPGTVISVGTRVQSAQTWRQPSCATQANKPAETSQSGHHASAR